MSTDKKQGYVLPDGVNYTAVATAVPSVGGALDQPTNVISNEFSSIPEARNLTWCDDFFEDDEDVVAVFDFDYEAMESFYTNVGWVWMGATLLYTPIFVASMIGLAPCYLRKNVAWNVKSQHVAVTRDGIRFVRDRRQTCWGWPCTDAGKNSKTVPFDMITDCGECLLTLVVIRRMSLTTNSRASSTLYRYCRTSWKHVPLYRECSQCRQYRYGVEWNGRQEGASNRRSKGSTRL